MVPGGGARAKDWLAAAGGRGQFDQEIFKMLSKRFFAWVGVGVLSVATIPTLAAPQLRAWRMQPPGIEGRRDQVHDGNVKGRPLQSGYG